MFLSGYDTSFSSKMVSSIDSNFKVDVFLHLHFISDVETKTAQQQTKLFSARILKKML